MNFLGIDFRCAHCNRSPDKVTYFEEQWEARHKFVVECHGLTETSFLYDEDLMEFKKSEIKAIAFSQKSLVRAAQVLSTHPTEGAEE